MTGAFAVATYLGAALAWWMALVQPPGIPPDAVPPRGLRPGAELPPPPGLDDGTIEEVELTPEQEAELRQQQFDEHLAKANSAAASGRHEEALREFAAALELQPGDPAALLGQARSREARTPKKSCPRSAIQAIQLLRTYDPRGEWMRQRGTLVGWMGRCGTVYASERLALATDLAGEEPGSPGRPDDVRVVVAELRNQRAERAAVDDDRLAQNAAALQELENYRKECAEAKRTPVLRALVLQAELYRTADNFPRAIAILRDLIKAYPQTDAALEATESVTNLEFEMSVREMEEKQGGRPTQEAQAAYERGLVALRRGDLGIAESELTTAIEASRWFQKPYTARGDVRARSGRVVQAIADLKRAVAMDRTDYNAHLLLGRIYKKEFAGAEDEAARGHLESALRLRPDIYVLHRMLGELYSRDDRDQAREHYRRFIRAAGAEDPEVKLAQRALEELDREVEENEPPRIVAPPQESLRLLDPDLQRLINEAYLWGERQDMDRAEKKLREARDRFPNEPIVLNELAKVVSRVGRTGDARALWEQSLAMQEDQVEVHERLGLLLKDDLPQQALPHLRRAAELGSSHARFTLSDLLWKQNEFIEASEQLDRYLLEAGDFYIDFDRAQSLRAHIDRVFMQVYVAAGIFMALLIGIPAWRIYRLYRGASLGQLLERDPKSFPEVARILSLIRHEILKHNTAFLVDVGRALEFDTPDADARAATLSRRLFGDEGDPRIEARRRAGGDQVRLGIYGRFLGYVQELEKVARTHGVTLNLRRKDPIFRPIIRAFEELARRVENLRNPTTLRPDRKLELARVLERNGHVLGRQAFERLSGLIRALCIVHVDRDLIEEVYDEVRGEEQFADRDLVPLAVEGSTASIRIFRTDLQDILANVLRNSLKSSLSYARPPVGLGVFLDVETDDITGLSTLAIRIADRSPEQLSNEMLRGRYVERGMGITVDLLSRYDGSIAVEPETDWEKAVVLRFFIVEDELPTGGEP